MKLIAVALLMFIKGCTLFATVPITINPLPAQGTNARIVPIHSEPLPNNLHLKTGTLKGKKNKPKGKFAILTNYKYIGMAFALAGMCFLLVALLPWAAAGTLRACIIMILLGLSMVGIRHIFRPASRKANKGKSWFRRVFLND